MLRLSTNINASLILLSQRQGDPDLKQVIIEDLKCLWSASRWYEYNKTDYRYRHVNIVLLNLEYTQKKFLDVIESNDLTDSFNRYVYLFCKIKLNPP